MAALRTGWYELHLQIRQEQADQAKTAADAQDLNLSSWVRIAIREKLERDNAE